MRIELTLCLRVFGGGGAPEFEELEGNLDVPLLLLLELEGRIGMDMGRSMRGTGPVGFGLSAGLAVKEGSLWRAEGGGGSGGEDWIWNRGPTSPFCFWRNSRPIE